MKERVYIIGTGAVGKPLAVFLQQKGVKVTLLRGSVDNQESYTKPVEVLLNNEELVTELLEFSTLSNFDRLEGLVVLTNKSPGNAQLADKLKDRIGMSPVVLLQNGLGVETPFVDRQFKELYRGVLFLASQTLNNGQVSYKPVATSPIGTIRSESTNVSDILNLMNCEDFTFKEAEDIETITWEKAIANCVFNSICPLLDVDNGIFHRNDAVFRLAKRIIAECIAVAHEEEILLSQEALEERCLYISKMSDGQLISTLQDIRSGKQTEIETLNLAVSSLAEKHGKPHLASETRLLGEMIKLKSGY